MTTPAGAVPPGPVETDPVEVALREASAADHEMSLVSRVGGAVVAVGLLLLLVWTTGALWPRTSVDFVGGGAGTGQPTRFDLRYVDHALTRSTVVDVRSPVPGVDVVRWTTGSPSQDAANLAVEVRVRDCALVHELEAAALRGEDTLELVVDLWWGQVAVPVDVTAGWDAAETEVCPLSAD